MLHLAAVRLAETLGTFNQQNLALTLWAFARFSFCPSAAIMTACSERATELAEVCPVAVAIVAQVKCSSSGPHPVGFHKLLLPQHCQHVCLHGAGTVCIQPSSAMSCC